MTSEILCQTAAAGVLGPNMNPAHTVRAPGTLGSGPTHHMAPKCIAGPQIDAGTSFVIIAPTSHWSEGFNHLINELRTPRCGEVEARERADGLVRHLPISDSDLWQSNEPLTARVRVWGRKRRYLELEFADRALVSVDCESGQVQIRIKKCELWADGLELWMRRWLGLFSRQLDRQHDPDTWLHPKWETKNVELCADFIDLSIHWDDAKRFTTNAKRRNIAQLTDEERLGVESRFGGKVGTIEMGTRRSPTSMVIYHKSEQLRTVKQVEPSQSTYAPTWQRSPCYRPDAEVVRVELRMNGRGLRFKGDGLSVDLSRPMTLLDRAALGAVWRSETERRRLTVSDASRSRRCSTDPRWVEVQRATSVPYIRLRQDRAVQKRTHQHRLRREDRKIARCAIMLSALVGEPTTDPAKLGAHVERSLARTDVDAEKALRSAKASCAYIWAECAAYEQAQNRTIEAPSQTLMQEALRST